MQSNKLALDYLQGVFYKIETSLRPIGPEISEITQKCFSICSNCLENQNTSLLGPKKCQNLNKSSKIGGLWGSIDRLIEDRILNLVVTPLREALTGLEYGPVYSSRDGGELNSKEEIISPRKDKGSLKIERPKIVPSKSFLSRSKSGNVVDMLKDEPNENSSNNDSPLHLGTVRKNIFIFRENLKKRTQLMLIILLLWKRISIDIQTQLT